MPSQISIALSWSGFCRAGLAEPRKSLRLKAFSELPAYGVILRRYPRLGQRIEESGLSNVGQANDSALKRHVFSFMDQPPMHHRAQHGRGGGARSASGACGADQPGLRLKFRGFLSSVCLRENWWRLY